MASDEEVESGFQDIEFDNFRCGQCENYLSIPPIYNFDDDDVSYNICGRCDFDRTDRRIARNPIFELLAKNIKFPCSNSENCEEKFRFGKKILHHELECQYRIIRCPVCKQPFNLEIFVPHFEEEHSILTVKDKLVQVGSLFEVRTGRLAFLVTNKSNKYLIRIFVDSRNITIKIEMFTKTIENHLINIIVGNVTQRVQFNQCSFSRITLFYRENLDKVPLIINVIPIEEITENLEVDEIKATVSSSLECPICCYFMKYKIYVCVMGHSICHSCADQLPLCPFCKTAVEGTRNYTLEDLAEKTV